MIIKADAREKEGRLQGCKMNRLGDGERKKKVDERGEPS